MHPCFWWVFLQTEHVAQIPLAGGKAEVLRSRRGGFGGGREGGMGRTALRSRGREEEEAEEEKACRRWSSAQFAVGELGCKAALWQRSGWEGSGWQSQSQILIYFSALPPVSDSVYCVGWCQSEDVARWEMNGSVQFHSLFRYLFYKA